MTAEIAEPVEAIRMNSGILRIPRYALTRWSLKHLLIAIVAHIPFQSHSHPFFDIELRVFSGTVYIEKEAA